MNAGKWWLLVLCVASCATESNTSGAGGSDSGSDVASADGSDGLDGTATGDVVTGDGGGSDGSDGVDALDVTDSSDGTDAVDGTDGTDGAPDDVVAIRFVADDRANRTYQDGQIQFTGSFAWDKESNRITYASSWLPTEREWPRLYDDGPRSSGGHEAEDQTAGDGLFSTEVWFEATSDVTFEYGALNEFASWIWVGPNGQLSVSNGQKGPVAVPGLVFPKFGKRELEVSLDLSALNAEFATITAETHAVYLKGTMNSWTPVQLLDNGKKGDAVEGDGIFTYLHSQKLGPHDGLAYVGQHVQFVFVFAPKEADPADGLEYKFPVDALVEGVSARTGEVGGDLVDEPVVLEPDSYGKVKNTTVVVTGPPPECDAATACPEGKVCSGDSCIQLGPECSPESPCPEGKVCEAGSCVAAPDGCGAGPACGPGQACEQGACVAIETGCGAGSPCPEGQECKVGQCIPVEVAECSPADPCESGFICQSGTCVVDLPVGEGPAVSLIDPAKGPASGGTPVTISGSHFATGATVRFGTAEATEVSVKTTGTITAVSPPGVFGPVTVTVRNPGGLEGAYPGGFQYTSFAAPTLGSLAPVAGAITGGDAVTLTGTGFQPGAKVLFGISQAGQVSVAPGGSSLTCVTPAVSAVGPSDVTVQNPDGQSATLPGAFTFKPGLVQFAVIQAPYDYTVAPAQLMPKARVQIYHPGVTPGEGAGAGLVVALGTGPKGVPPTDAGKWSWVEATYVGQGGSSNNDDIWEAQFPPDAGTFDFGFRASLDGESWYYADRDPASADWSSPGTLVVAEPPVGLAIFSVTPPYGPLSGGTQVTVNGQNLDTASAVTVGGALCIQVSQTATSYTCVLPAGALGAADVSASGSNKTSTLSQAFRYTVVTDSPPSIDGVISEWSAGAALAEDLAVPGWDNNDLNRAWAAFDDDYLYLAVEGAVEASNALVLFVDTDFGAGTGYTPTTLADNSGALDAALTGSGIKVFTAGFGADFAVGAFGGQQQSGDVSDTGTAGIRSFAGGPGDLYWLAGDVLWGPAGLEVRVARSAVGLSPSAAGHEVALFVRIVNQDGEYTSPEGLPSSAAEDGSVDTVIRFWVN